MAQYQTVPRTNENTEGRDEPGYLAKQTPTYNRPNTSNRVYSGDERIRGGQIIGEAAGKELFGQDIAQTGTQIQDIVARRKAALDQTDPVSSKIREGRNEQIRSLRAQQGARGIQGGAAAGQEAQVQRAAQRDIGQQLFQNQQQSLSQYQKLVGNLASNQMALEMGYAELEKSGEYIPPPQSGGGRHNGSWIDSFMSSISPSNW